jgi:hypothetical protein
MNLIRSITAMLCAALFASVAGAQTQPADELPWDFDPYRVMIWVAGVEPAEVEGELGRSIHAFLDRDFESLWRTDLVAAPQGLSVIAKRNFDQVGYATLTADDPILVIKRNHENAARIRYPADVPGKLGSITTSKEYLDTVTAVIAKTDNKYLPEVLKLVQTIDGDLLDLAPRWDDDAIEAMLIPRGIAMELDPKPMMVEIDIAGRMGSLFTDYDKVFIVLVDSSSGNYRVAAREIDCMMRWPGPVIREQLLDVSQLPAAIGRCVRDGFAPLVRLDDIGTKSIQARLRAGGLILDDDSPGNVVVGDFLQPMLRKDDRDGEPSFLGIIDWTFLRTTEKEGPKLTLEIQSGRAGSLAGRRNSRTHRMAMKVRPVYPDTTLRLHAKGDPLAPLAGYDVYQKDLESGDMTLVGQTDWDGRLPIEKTDVPMRLLYVKNGSSILARLPIVPGQTPFETADLVGDDIRLQAEAYIRGVQNAIVDLVAIRKLIAANIRGHIQRGDLERAEQLLDNLRQQPSYDKLANDMELKKTQITSRNRTEQAKIDRLFSETRSLLIKHINPVFIRELETELNAAKGMPTAGQATQETAASEEG